MFMCPVCYYDEMPNSASEYHICPCCGTEFGNDDEDRTHAELREFWISTGAKWFYKTPPAMWNPWVQLARAGARLPYLVTARAFGTIVSTVRSVRQGHTSIGHSIVPCNECPELAQAA